MAISKQSDVHANLKLLLVDDHAGSCPQHPNFDLQQLKNNGEVDDIHGTNKQLSPKDYHTMNENLNSNQRRVSFPPNIKHQENGIRGKPKVPSYMVPTGSVRAKLREQGFLRFSKDGIEKNGITRRQSLPPSINGKLTSNSPRTQKLVYAASKGVIKSDKSLSSSIDGSGRNICTQGFSLHMG